MHDLFREGERLHQLHRRLPRAVPDRLAPRPRDQAAAVPRRGDRQRPSNDQEGAALRAGERSSSAPIPVTPDTPPHGRHGAQILEQRGPKGLAEWVLEQNRPLLTDTTMRDAHQSLLATRVRTFDLLNIAPATSHLAPELFSLETWGGATFDVAYRFLNEDPWDRLRKLKQTIPNILHADAAAGCQRRRLHQLPRQRRRSASSTRPRSRASTCSACSTA